MMAQKHLHELLKEDQEPFLLKNYIADWRCQLKKSSPKTHLQINKGKLISQNSNFPSNFCRKACFFSFHDSPDSRKSPLFEAKSPNNLFLLEAALRIQKQSSSKTKPQSKKSNGTAFGLFGSILKRLTHRTKNPNRETVNGGSKVSVKDILRWDLTVGKNNVISEEKSGREMGFSSFYNEEKSMAMDLDISCSCSQLEDFEEIFISNGVLENNSAFASFDKQFSRSPFHFVLQTSPPSRHEREDKENYELESLKRLQVEEEKEQCSPVSVLDRSFEEDDDDRHVDDDDDDNVDNGIDRFDLECSYAIVQRAKQQLLQKLCRFEKLAELDPAELEKRTLEQEQDDDNDNNGIYDQHESSSSKSETNIDGYNPKHIPDGMKRLVSDLIAEEETMQHNGYIDKQAAVERVCRRLDSWKDVESNTIDMMVEQDFRRDQIAGWKGNEEHIRETAAEVESAIFGLLLQELTEELVFLTGV